LVRLSPIEDVDEPAGDWPWQDLRVDALLSLGRLDEAAAILGPYEQSADERGRPSWRAGAARARGRLEAARGRHDPAEAAFLRGLEALEQVPMPFERALILVPYGRLLRRSGRRRDAAGTLRSAQQALVALRARPYLQRCERELAACGLTPVSRHGRDRERLTPQEHCVARLAAAGLSNREVAAELVLSVKTVEYHLTNTYGKLGITSRRELAAHFPDLASKGHGVA
jgi:ATP/maltotriose-dependent transcriptional regulator MalT